MSFQYPGIIKAAEAAANLRGLIRGGRELQPGERPKVANDLWTLQGYAQYWLLGSPRYGGEVPAVVAGELKIEAVEDCFDQLGALAQQRDKFDRDSALSRESEVDWQPLVIWAMETQRVLILGFQPSDLGISTAEADEPPAESQA